MDDEDELDRLLREAGLALPSVDDDEADDAGDGWDRWDSYSVPDHKGDDDGEE